MHPQDRGHGNHGGHGHGGGGHHGGHETHRHHSGCPHYYVGLGYGYPYYGYGYFGLGFGLGYSGRYGYGYFGLPYYSGYYSPYSSGYVARHVVYDDPQGALDLNVKPKSTEVFVDGYYVGTTGDFDGWPRYLWLSEDVHELIFYLDGHETVVREVAVYPGDVIDLKLRMQPGPSTPPEQITRYGSTPQPGDSYASVEPPAAAPRAPSPPPGIPAEIDLRTEAGRVFLHVSPGEASVYIDGRFVGIAGELAAIQAGLLMDPGEHVLQAFHPEHESQEQTILVEAGKKAEVVIDLTRPQGP